MNSRCQRPIVNGVFGKTPVTYKPSYSEYDLDLDSHHVRDPSYHIILDMDPVIHTEEVLNYAPLDLSNWRVGYDTASQQRVMSLAKKRTSPSKTLVEAQHRSQMSSFNDDHEEFGSSW